MKLPLLSLPTCAVLLLGWAATVPHAAAQTVQVTYFNFDDGNLASDPPATQPSTITVNNLGTTFTAGTTLNRAAGDLMLPTNSALRLTDSNNGGGNAKTFQFTVSTLGLLDLSLSYATQASNLNFTQTLFYSTNGGATFTQFGTGIAPTLAWTLQSFDLAAVPSINNQASVIFQIALTQSGQQKNEWNEFDNIQLIAAAIPEPATWVSGGLLAFIVATAQMRRGHRRSSQT